MRFPRLSNLFQRHRRVKSDPEISRFASAPIAIPETRPVSTTCIPELELHIPPSSTSFSDVGLLLTSCVPTSPCVLHPSDLAPASPLVLDEPPVAVPPLRYRASDPVQHHPHGVLAVLTDRVRDLETALLEECNANAVIPHLEAALEDERAAREAAERENVALREDVAALQGEVIRLRRDLFCAIAGGAQPISRSSSTSMSVGPLASIPTSTSVSTSDSRGLVRFAPEGAVSTNASAVVVAERDRLRHFVELMISVGAHKPVIDAAYQCILQGQDAEAALVGAIKRAMAQSDNVWRGLLEPVTGVRTQADYLAQLRCTLDARRLTLDWRKRAKFWKSAAKEDGRHVYTVTPSVSALSDVVDVVPAERQEKVEEMMNRLKGGTLPLQVVHTDLSYGDFESILAPTASEPLSVWTSATQSDIDAIACIGACTVEEIPITPETSLPATSSSMVLPMLNSTSTARISVAPSRALPPLPIESLYASSSIQDVSPSSMRASTSVSTQASAKSRRRNARVMGVPRVSIHPSPSDALTTCSAGPAPIVLVAPPPDPEGQCVDEEEPPEIGTRLQAPALLTPAPDSLPRALVEFGQGSDEDLVLVLHNDFSSTSFRASPNASPSASRSASPAGRRRRERAATTTSPPENVNVNVNAGAKKSSHLPVRMPGLKAIKRLSASIAISRPALQETTNVGGLPGSDMEAVLEYGDVKEESAGGRGRAKSVGAQVIVGGERDLGTGTPSARSSRIPMGRRFQRFGIGGQSDKR